MSELGKHKFQPDFNITPGETLRERLEELNLSQSELAKRANLSTKHVNQIMHGAAPITLETAIVLGRVTGVPARFWNRREADYREGLLRSNPAQLSVEDTKWLNSLPIKELQRRKKLPIRSDEPALFDAALTFFGVADREAWERIWRGPVASFRRSKAFASDPGAVVSWLRMAQLEAQSAKVGSFSVPTFRRALLKVRLLTAGGDANDVVEISASAGVVVVFVPEVKSCRISGAAWWASPSRGVIALSDRYKKDDFFWFTYFHEAAHLLLHSKKETFVDGGTDDDLLEEEANRFATDFLVPPERANHLKDLTTETAVITFAKEIGISPGIVVGRLQHDRLWDWKQGNRLKRSLQIIDAE
jgi:HTH-type transcriptional regulator/antitoxin HigA